jgi:hypothetical protein
LRVITYRSDSVARHPAKTLTFFLSLVLMSAVSAAQEVAAPGPGPIAPALDARTGSAAATMAEPPPRRGYVDDVKAAKRASATFRPQPSSSAPPTQEPPAAAPASLLTDFDGIDFTNIIPPDGAVAAGPASLVLSTNGSLSIRGKTGTLIASASLAAFFASVRQAGESAFDPRAIYDAGAGRFFVSAGGKITNAGCTAGVNCVSHFFLAVSKTANPRTTGSADWFFYGFDATLNGSMATGNWADFPGLGVDQDVVVLTSNMFSFSNDVFQYAKVRILNKATLISGDSVTWFDFSNLTDPVTGFPSASLQPALTFGAPGVFFLISQSRTAGSCDLIAWGIANALSSPALSALTATASRSSCTTPPDALQPGGGIPLDSGDTRVINAVYRNGSLWTAQSINMNLGSGNVAAVRWAQVDLSGWPASADILQDGTLGADGVWFFYPAIMADAANNVAVAFTRSSATEFASADYAFRLSADLPGSLPVNAVLKAGSANYQLPDSNGENRWGDYSAIAVDPVDGSFWMLAEYAVASNRWGTWVGNFRPTSSVTLVAAVLPSSRSVLVGTPATAFGTIINAGSGTATACTLAPGTSVNATFAFQTTDPATNQVTGTLNTPVDIPAGATQSFVFAFTPTAPIAPTDMPVVFGCANATPAMSVPGVNTLLLSASATPVPDIVALAATLNNDGIVNLTGATGTGVFAVATANVGASGMVTASADTGAASPPVTIALCQTNPTTGQCISAIGPSVTTQINANATPTFGIFVTGTGSVPFAPAVNRVFVRFQDNAGATRGSTSVAVRTR